jgi:hypothetical protein
LPTLGARTRTRRASSKPCPTANTRSLDDVGEELAPVQPSRRRPSNPPQKALEKQTKAQSEQLERQRQKLGPEG